MSQKVSLAVAVLLAVSLTACGGKEPPKQKPAEESRLTAQSFKALSIEGDSLVKNGRWLLKAKSASADAMGKVGKMEGVTAALTDADGEISVTAETCSFVSESAIDLAGDVEVVWKGYSARGRSLTFDLKAGILTSTEEIELRGDFIRVTGKGLRVLAEGRVAFIDKDVHAVLGRM